MTKMRPGQICLGLIFIVVSLCFFSKLHLACSVKILQIMLCYGFIKLKQFFPISPSYKMRIGIFAKIIFIFKTFIAETIQVFRMCDTMFKNISYHGPSACFRPDSLHLQPTILLADIE